jgi:hypothetical protein
MNWLLFPDIVVDSMGEETGTLVASLAFLDEVTVHLSLLH